MDGNEGIGGKTPNPEKRKRLDMGTDASPGSGDEESSFLPYLKPNYKRLYPENSTQVEFKVFVQGLRSEKIGNKSPIYLNHIFSSSPEIKGVASIHRVNANKIVLIFKQYNTANNFLNNTDFLQRHNIKAFIPAAQIEKTGIIRFKYTSSPRPQTVPTHSMALFSRSTSAHLRPKCTIRKGKANEKKKKKKNFFFLLMLIKNTQESSQRNVRNTK
ncbi:hypothetical protein K1T71_002711 [Dendrolimus kikuchii]|uniref:Uncharacterized protein n=1 Tax=Dendrolimus kikuchii TaxID=765133 RepID=A0ACC1DE10_9NEOP|nr:hypothetical protein K1T71_002711 [Dendrolimus kikuchii]